MGRGTDDSTYGLTKKERESIEAIPKNKGLSQQHNSRAHTYISMAAMSYFSSHVSKWTGICESR